MTGPRDRHPLRAVAVPTEHGGWGLTLEPGLLGILLAPSAAGALLAAAAFAAFLIRTPGKLVLVDTHRRRVLPRTRLAVRVVALEGAVFVALVIGILATATNSRWWIPLAASAPLVLIEFWYESRSRGRRLVPEIAGSCAIAATAAAIVVADDGPVDLAIAAWLVLVARVVVSIPHVRSQIERAHHRATPPRQTDVADAVAGIVVLVAVVIEPSIVVGAVAVTVLALVQRLRRSRPLAPIPVIGVLQMLFGIAVAVATAIGWWVA